jgi:hypothetical protein
MGSERGGKPVIVDFNRHFWLPDDWGQGVKATSPITRKGLIPGNGGTYTVIMSPDGKTFYHRYAAEEYAGYKFTEEGGRNGQIRKAQLQSQQTIQVVRAEIKGTTFTGSERVGVDPDRELFKILSPAERKCIAPKEAFHFCVISARRATTVKGVQDIFTVESQLKEAGITPTWYVDKDSVKDYQKLGLRAKVGGKLTPSRNAALNDASRMRKVCVQCSDDISAWEYRHGKRATERTDDAVNKACKEATRMILSPVAAAQFILAKMRAAPGEKKPQLGGVYMLGSCSRTFAGAEFVRQHFILGDFFVVDKSNVRFDDTMTLKEDYDFSCAHIKAHGSVMRCQRMTLSVKHYTNEGGAVSERDKKGRKEKLNIAILNKKWPGCFRPNPKRQNEVIMKWRGASTSDDDDDDGDSEVVATDGDRAKKASTAKKVKKLVTKKKTSTSKKPGAGVNFNATVKYTGAECTSPYMSRRCKRIHGKRVRQCLGMEYTDGAGKPRKYSLSDLRYDIDGGRLKLGA